jgi:predicted ATPase
VLAAVERRLSNAEIADELYISVRTVESHIASLRRKLDSDSRSKLITIARTRRRTAVPLPQNSFVGRADDLSTVRALLDGTRWVTLTGPAGCGKTRLARELAATDLRVPVVADLQHSTTNEVVRAVAGAIGLGTAGTSDLVTACAVALEAQPYLLVVDNCDRVTSAVGDVIGQLLVLTRSLTVLATSRSLIGCSDETIYQLAPLTVGGHENAGAVQLFLDRARSAAPTARFSDADGEPIARICHRLDGLPLAIELAAGRVRHLPLLELADRLDEGFGSLDRAGQSSRHSTLEAAFDWTWDLLEGDERSVLSMLAALPGTFDLELAEAITFPGAGRVVLRLLDRSLVSQTVTISGLTQFRLLDSLRAFALDRTRPAIVLEVRRRHAAYHADLAASLAGRARTDDSRVAVEAARRLCPEANAAIDWAIAQQHELALPLTRSLAVLMEHYGANIDSLDAIAHAARDPHVRAEATSTDLLEIGIALSYGDLDLVAELTSLALNLADDDRSELAARHLAGYADAYANRGTSALRHFQAAERLAGERLDLWQLASVQQGKGIALRGSELDDPQSALAAFESAMKNFALAGDSMHVNNARYMMASTAAQTGHDTSRAIVWAEQCATYARDAGNRHELAHALLTRGALGAGSGIDTYLFDAVDTFRAVGDLRCLTRSYLLLARDRLPFEQVPLLQQALDITVRAHDLTNQATTLARLIRAHWESGAHREAAVTLGALIDLAGYEPAIERCPESMTQELDHWDTAIAEGRSRWRA